MTTEKQATTLYYRLGTKTRTLKCSPGSIGAKLIAEGRGSELSAWLTRKNEDSLAFERSFEEVIDVG